MQINDTAAIVTGGASGLGGATAKALAAKGAHVFAFDLAASIEKAEQVDGVTYVEADVTDGAALRPAVEQASSSGMPLRIVVNCAGIGPSSRILSKKGTHDLDLFHKVVNINLAGTFNVMTLAAEAMAQTEPLEDDQRGVVINTASVAAIEGQIGQIAYSASKGGVVGMTVPAARDLASHGIRVMTIAPGIIDTPMLATVSEEFRAGLAAGVPFPKRLGRPDEYAQLAVDIVEHDYLNGDVIRLDGSLRMAPR
ncbi:SDR family NAD(P)-dependent oxidoreductase [Prauserella rugosa]|uniref:NAD(P)-dependent dehydrogenase (Short-subunit alcohol dehydrogenase family) n=1 Tax=Prauserella rugosa TaxID=43354 RepID=A0A660CEG7_9PSEU|nr:SDR family NAD(P)-dependent oxidoreductase [Prauserella rugosa]KMS72001.1 3-hydroxy-2-methylbutyryl-CoA dehydrogenase [Streptomyces regensis]TWH21792.1 NAD(P)-dependent dehydrogenase (short-subunit alcohol dehydrogenase family) [Prauserella rugosa]